MSSKAKESVRQCLAYLKSRQGTIGIVLCKKKHESLVEVTLPKDAKIHAREYQLYLPSKEEQQRQITGIHA